MCILTGKEIKRRAKKIFNHGSYDKSGFQEASYDLRVATDTYMRIGDKLYSPQRNPFDEPVIVIKPGELAILPTVESFNMPKNLAGTVNIKFSQSRKGLIPLFAPKVDPYFGRGHKDERLFLSVSNLGSEPIKIRRAERVFNIQFHTLVGKKPDSCKKDAIGPRIEQDTYDIEPESYLGFVNVIREQATNELGDRLSTVEHGTSRVVQFGIFLIVSALLAGAFTVLFSLTSQLNPDQNALADMLLSSSVTLGIFWVIAISLALASFALAISGGVFLWRTMSRTDR